MAPESVSPPETRAAPPAGDLLRRAGGSRDPVLAGHTPADRCLAAVLVPGAGPPAGWAAPDGALMRWDPVAGRLARVADAPRHTARLAVAPGGGWLAVAGRRRVQRRRLPDGALISEHDVPHGITAVAISDEGRLLVGAGDMRSWVGPLPPGGGLGALATHRARVGAAAWLSPTVYVSGDAAGVVVRVDLESGQARRVARLPGAITALAPLPAGGLAAGDAGGRLVIWGDDTRPAIHGVTALGRIVALVPHDGALWAAGPSTAARIDVTAGTVRHRIPLARDHRAARGVAGIAAGRLWSWDARGLQGWALDAGCGDWWGHTGGVRALLAHGGRLWSGDRSGTLCSWDLATRARQSWHDTGRPGIQALAPHPAGGLCFGSTAGALGHMPDGEDVLAERLPAHEGPVTVLRALTVDGSPWLLSGGADGVLRAWDGPGLRPVSARALHGDRLRALALVPAPDGGPPTVLTGGYDGRLVASPLVGGPTLLAVDAHPRPLTGVGHLADGSLLSAALDGRLRRWSPGGDRLAEATGDPEGIVSMAVLDGDRVLTLGRGGTVCLHAAATLAPLARLDLGRALDAVAVVGPGAVVASDQRGGLHALATG